MRGDKNTFHTHTHTHTHTLCTTQFFISFHFWGDLLPSPSSPCTSYDGCTLQHARFSKLVFLWLSQRVNKSLLLLCLGLLLCKAKHILWMCSNVLTIPLSPHKSMLHFATTRWYVFRVQDLIPRHPPQKNGLLVKWTTRLLHSLASLTNNPEYIVVPLSFWQ